ncbi:carboxypeptidase-like regulatory domain-containing protein [Halomonas sp. YLGW01]|uniref:carboxypeptidase-like regulatory domain-containing protein n=1 Tax=Halomonas sp. YLGW01 TaxID=2773308 RepID=UPI00177D96E6|nr:carboxypeptidase-like regulatory domain-containing protein [Halomonas sp. YLGW01]
MMRWSMVAMLALALTGCQIAPQWPTTPPGGPTVEDLPGPDQPRQDGRVPRQVSFPEREYAVLEKTGNASIRGRLYQRDAAGQVVSGAGETISIAPVTTYSAEAAEVVLSGRSIAPADPRAREYTHYARTDANGYFVASGLPAGDYYVAGRVGALGGPPIIHQVSVRRGQTISVTLKR